MLKVPTAKSLIGSITNILLWLNCSCVYSITVQDQDIVAQMMFSIYQEHTLIPELSLTLPDIDQDSAYGIQRQFIQRRLVNDKILGFKGGLTSTKSQARFKAHAPISGVLLASGYLNNGAVIKHERFHRLMLETELGFILNRSIYSAISDIEQLKQSIESIVPIIEVVDLNYQNLAHLSATDLIMSNVAAHSVILGAPVMVSSIKDINALPITLQQNNIPIHTALGGDALGNQWFALQWLINHLVKQGWVLQKGQLLITGALGPMQVGKSSRYQATFGPLGSINFSID